MKPVSFFIRPKQAVLLFLFVNLTIGGIAQERYAIKKLVGHVKLDGFLDEAQWQEAEEACDFVVTYPNFGDRSCHESYIRLFYDDEALYVGGMLFDQQPDSINYMLSQRDDFGNADWFKISIDPYAKNVTSFSFAVTSAGVELDAIEYVNESDLSWNAVWKSATLAREDGWSFEMRIPFSAIRFPNTSVQNWHFNMARQVRRQREESYWNPVDPRVYGIITQAGKLQGLNEIKSPVRLSFTPYVTGYLENAYDEVLQKQVWRNRLAGGLDLKYGLNDAFTLDMTLIPDFGQAVSDRQILNLGPFEVFYDENRPFFLEAMDLFRIGGIFYSRRVGSRPVNYGKAYAALDAEKGEELVSNPQLSPLINATKISGRTAGGLGIAVFNAIEGETFATIADSSGNTRKFQTNPFTNYNVLVLSQNLKNNSSISLANTNVLRDGSAKDANVTAFTTTLFSQDGSHQLESNIRLSAAYQEGKTVFGHSFYSGISKVSGVWGYTFSYSELSNTYDHNDLGFLYVNNSRNYGVKFRLNDYTVGSLFLRKWANFSVAYEELYKPQNFTSLRVDFSGAGTTRKFLTFGFNGSVDPLGYVNHFESRVFGRSVKFNPSYLLGGFYSSDYSKVLALDFRASIRDYLATDQSNLSMTLSPRLRASDRIFLVWNTLVELYQRDFGYVSALEEAYTDQVLLGVRNREVVENSLKLEFIFTKRMGVDLRFRHYWQQVTYNAFLQLGNEMETAEIDYNPVSEDGKSLHNTAFNAFTIDFNYRWVFMPGSELRLVYKNNLFHTSNALTEHYFDTFETLFDHPQINSISMKLLVYIDAVYFRRKQKNKI